MGFFFRINEISLAFEVEFMTICKLNFSSLPWQEEYLNRTSISNGIVRAYVGISAPRRFVGSRPNSNSKKNSKFCFYSNLRILKILVCSLFTDLFELIDSLFFNKRFFFFFFDKFMYIRRLSINISHAIWMVS